MPALARCGKKSSGALIEAPLPMPRTSQWPSFRRASSRIRRPRCSRSSLTFFASARISAETAFQSIFFSSKKWPHFFCSASSAKSTSLAQTARASGAPTGKSVPGRSASRAAARAIGGILGPGAGPRPRRGGTGIDFSERRGSPWEPIGAPAASKRGRPAGPAASTMKASLSKLLLGAAALCAGGTLAWASIQRLDLPAMMKIADNAVIGTITHKETIRIDHPVDGPELYYTSLTIEGRSLKDGKNVTVDVWFGGGFVDARPAVHNSEAPSDDDQRIG